MSRMQNEEVHSATDSLKEKAKEVQQNLRDMGSHARDAAAATYGNLRDQAQGYIEQGKERAVRWEKSLEEAVQEQPLRAILIAAGAGMLLGLLWRRR